ncbi:hypothetical protein [Belliella baltica]|uniref:hypothetical protein n=1 Tax=Belliella baltica TaxID=232259 RepID=UPI0012F976B2|nr:hypothetical protein [Belliella baltica]
MIKLFKIVLLITVVILTSCGRIEKKIIDSNNGKNQLTVLYFGNGKYIVDGKYNSNIKPNFDYLKSDNFYEYHTGLAKWTVNGIEIYSQYGTFDTIATNGKLIINKVSSKEFEELKKNTDQYTYFYY